MNARKVLIFLLLSTAASIATAQGPRRDVGENVRVNPDSVEVGEDDRFALSIDVEVANVDVVVTTENDDPIRGLVKEQFQVLVDGIEQPITNFRPAEAPITVVIVIEFSDSFAYYYDNVLGPAWGFIQSLRPEDWTALVSFDQNPEILSDFTRNRNELLAGLQRLQRPIFRETAIFDALHFTLDRLESVDGKKAIFLLTAGVDTISRASYGDTLDRFESSDTILYAVGMGQLFLTFYQDQLSALDSITIVQAENALRQMAEASGGAAFFPKFEGEYQSIYQTVSAHLRYQYSLGFVPTGLEKDDDLKEIEIRIAPIDLNGDGNPDKLKVRHKRGLYLTDPD